MSFVQLGGGGRLCSVRRGGGLCSIGWGGDLCDLCSIRRGGGCRIGVGVGELEIGE